jgi:hypothetical protein
VGERAAHLRKRARLARGRALLVPLVRSRGEVGYLVPRLVVLALVSPPGRLPQVCEDSPTSPTKVPFITPQRDLLASLLRSGVRTEPNINHEELYLDQPQP